MDQKRGSWFISQGLPVLEKQIEISRFSLSHKEVIERDSVGAKAGDKKNNLSGWGVTGIKNIKET